jgi:hypothetical protein
MWLTRSSIIRRHAPEDKKKSFFIKVFHVCRRRLKARLHAESGRNLLRVQMAIWLARLFRGETAIALSHQMAEFCEDSFI